MVNTRAPGPDHACPARSWEPAIAPVGRRGLDPHRGSPRGTGGRGEGGEVTGVVAKSGEKEGGKQGRQQGGTRSPSVRGGQRGAERRRERVPRTAASLPGGVQAVQQRRALRPSGAGAGGEVVKPLPRENRGAAGDGRIQSVGCHHLTMGRQQAKVTPGAASAHETSETTWPERRRTRLGRRQPGGGPHRRERPSLNRRHLEACQNCCEA